MKVLYHLQHIFNGIQDISPLNIASPSRTPSKTEYVFQVTE